MPDSCKTISSPQYLRALLLLLDRELRFLSCAQANHCFACFVLG